MVGEERETELEKKLIKTIYVSDLNKTFRKWFKYDDRIVNFRYPKKMDNKITKDVFLSIENQIKNIRLAQYEFTLDDKPLIEKELIGSKIISEKKHSSINTIELNLENGVKIYLKPTENEIDSFKFEAQSLGGYSHASLEDYHSAKSAEDLINGWIGFGSFSRSEIKNKIDEETNLKIWIGRFYEGLEGGAKADKTEELFKLIYLRFAHLKIDEVVFQNFISFSEEQKRNENLNYKKKFNRKVFEELCKNLAPDVKQQNLKI